MFSALTYGRIISRAVANTIAQGDLDHIPAISSWPGRLISRFLSKQASIGKQGYINFIPYIYLLFTSIFLYSDCAPKPSPCHLVSAVCGFSKINTPRNHRPISKPAQSALIGNCLFGDDAYFIATHPSADVLGTGQRSVYSHM